MMRGCRARLDVRWKGRNSATRLLEYTYYQPSPGRCVAVPFPSQSLFQGRPAVLALA